MLAGTSACGASTPPPPPVSHISAATLTLTALPGDAVYESDAYRDLVIKN